MICYFPVENSDFFYLLESAKDTELIIKFPQTQYITMGNADPGKILSKVKEFNDGAIGDGLRLSDVQLQEIHDLVNGNTNNLDTKLNLLFQLLKWPIGKSNMISISNEKHFSMNLIFF